MNNSEIVAAETNNAVAKLPLLAAVFALIGLVDSIYLTIHHYSGEQVPCSVTGGCGAVLNSEYAEIAGIPLAIFGAAAYFVLFSLAILTAFGNRAMWKFFGVQVTLMAIFTLWLLYLQKFVIQEFCQYCLLSAATTFTLFFIALISKFWRSK
jgi:uncharacterized membrane protein